MSNDSQITAKELTHWVRVALTHLYDAAFLQTHLLGSALDAGPAEQALDAVSRAQKLRRILLDCIESLRPQSKRRGRVRLDAARQIYREHERGLEAVASLFAEKHGWPKLHEHNSSNALNLAQVEANRLKQAIHLEAIDP